MIGKRSANCSTFPTFPTFSIETSSRRLSLWLTFQRQLFIFTGCEIGSRLVNGPFSCLHVFHDFHTMSTAENIFSRFFFSSFSLFLFLTPSSSFFFLVFGRFHTSHHFFSLRETPRRKVRGKQQKKMKKKKIIHFIVVLVTPKEEKNEFFPLRSKLSFF